MSNASPQPTRRGGVAAYGLLYVALCYAVAFFLPAYEITNLPDQPQRILADRKSPDFKVRIPGWQAWRLPLSASLNPNLDDDQRLPAGLMVLANVALGVGFVLGLGGRWRACAAAALLALGCGLSCLFNPRLRLDEFRAGYYVWLASFALLAVVAIYQAWRRPGLV